MPEKCTKKETDGLLIAPGKDGFYKLEKADKKFESENIHSKIEVNKTITSRATDIQKPQIEFDYDSCWGIYHIDIFNTDFVGNNFYISSYFQAHTGGAGGMGIFNDKKVCALGNNLTGYVEKGSEDTKSITLKDIIPKKYHIIIDSQINSYKKIYDRKVKVESNDDKEYISEEDLTIMRKDGVWKLFVPIKFGNFLRNHYYFEDFLELDCPLPDSLTSYNELCMPFSEIKNHIPDVIDAVSSPDKSMLVVQTSEKLLVFSNPLKGIDKPITEIPIDKDEKIILNQWCTGSYVEKWDKELSALLR